MTPLPPQPVPQHHGPLDCLHLGAGSMQKCHQSL